MSEIFGYDLDKSWDYENGFYLTSNVKRLSKAIAHYELYKSIVDLPGHVLEFGVFKGTSLIRFLTYRDMLESSNSRKVIGFDVFGKFPKSNDKDDSDFIKRFKSQGGDGIPVDQLEVALQNKLFNNYELVKGNIFDTIPEYIAEHPELRIALLHIDVDVYEPSKFILDKLFDRVVKGGLVVFDDYATVAGETRAVDEFLNGLDYQVQKLPMSHIPCFIKK